MMRKWFRGYWSSYLFCGMLPWHRWTAIGRPTEWSLHVRCDRCGREYGYNVNVDHVLPWHEVEDFYREQRGYRAAR